MVKFLKENGVDDELAEAAGGTGLWESEEEGDVEKEDDESWMDDEGDHP